MDLCGHSCATANWDVLNADAGNYRYIVLVLFALWHHQTETFPALLTFCAVNSPVIGEFPSQRTVAWSFVFSDLRLNKRLSKQSRRRWFETPSPSIWRHCNGYIMLDVIPLQQDYNPCRIDKENNSSFHSLNNIYLLLEGAVFWVQFVCRELDQIHLV